MRYDDDDDDDDDDDQDVIIDVLNATTTIVGRAKTEYARCCHQGANDIMIIIISLSSKTSRSVREQKFFGHDAE